MVCLLMHHLLEWLGVVLLVYKKFGDLMSSGSHRNGYHNQER